MVGRSQKFVMKFESGEEVLGKGAASYRVQGSAV